MKNMTETVINPAFTQESFKDIFNLDFSEIGKHISHLLFCETKNRKLPIFNKYGDHNNNIILKYEYCIYPKNNKYLMGSIFVIEVQPNFMTIDHEDIPKLYKIKNLFDAYLAFNDINRTYKLIDKNHLNIYDIEDLLEEITIINS